MSEAGAGRIAGVELRRLALPLVVPYSLSYRTFDAFEPFLVRVVDDTGRTAFGEGHVSPGSSTETRAGGWSLLTEHAPKTLGEPSESATARATRAAPASPVAAGALVAALEMLAAPAVLQITERAELALLAPVQSATPDAIVEEVEARLREGFRTFKIKVGKDVDDDLRRVRLIQRAAAGRAALRIDANRAYDRAQGCRFAAALDPAHVELFEQPCAAEDWDANAAVARACPVPLMLDEPICSLADVDRAAAMDGVGFCKVKLKRFSSLARLHAVIECIRDRGLGVVLGDGLGAEPACWMEACVGRGRIAGAGEFNGFLKPRARLFREPLHVAAGALVLEPGDWPQLDPDILEAHTLETQRFGAPVD